MKKIIIIIFFLISLLQAASVAYLIAAPQKIYAKESGFIPNVEIPGTEIVRTEKGIDIGSGDLFSRYVRAFYQYSIGAIGIFAVTMIMWGGLKWMSAAGNTSVIGEAKTIINNAVIGLVLGLLSYVILYTVNPDLVKLKPPALKVVHRVSHWCEEYPLDKYYIKTSATPGCGVHGLVITRESYEDQAKEIQIVGECDYTQSCCEEMISCAGGKTDIMTKATCLSNVCANKAFCKGYENRDEASRLDCLEQCRTKIKEKCAFVFRGTEKGAECTPTFGCAEPYKCTLKGESCDGLFSSAWTMLSLGECKKYRCE